MRWNKQGSSDSAWFKGTNTESVIHAGAANGVVTVAGLYPKSSGKWYAEFMFDGSDASAVAGVVKSSFFNNSVSLGSNLHSYGFKVNGEKIFNSSASAYGSSWTNERIGVALDLDNGELYFSINGAWQNSGNPVTNTNPAFTGLTGEFIFASTMFTKLNVAWLALHPYEMIYFKPAGYQYLRNPRSVTLTLRDDTTAVIPNTEFNWAFFDEPKGDLLATPSANGTAFTDIDGIFVVNIGDTSRTVGGIGSLLISDTTGIPAVQCRSWYMSVFVADEIGV